MSLQGLAKALGGTLRADNVMELDREGAIVTYRLSDRGVDTERALWTEVSTPRPEQYPLSITITPGRVSPGEARLDLDLGTPLFDKYFVVEAAPSDVVRILIDEPARQFLIEQRGELHVGTTRIRFAKPGEVLDPETAIALVDFVTGLARRVREAYAEADARPPATDGDPYRPQAVATDDARQRHREGELQNLRLLGGMQQRDSVRQGNRVMLAIVVSVLLVMAVAALVQAL